VFGLLLDRAPITFEIALLAMLTALAIAIPLAMLYCDENRVEEHDRGHAAQNLVNAPTWRQRA